MRRLLLSLVLLLAAPGCRGVPVSPEVPPATGAQAQAVAAPAVEPVRLTVVGTNDLHGWVSPHRTSLKGGVEVREGGAAAFAGYVARLRADNPDGVLLLDAGDLFQGTLASNLTEGAIVFDVYNHLGYTAAAIGNHEFDYGPVGPGATPSRPGDDPFGALKARIQQARFPVLSANIREAASGQRPEWLGNDGTRLVTVKGLKVGLIGLTTTSTPETTNPTNVASLRFEALAPTALEASQRLRAQGAQVVIGIAHAGGKCPKLGDPRDTSSCETQDGEIYAMLDGLPPGTLDALVAGHTHQPMGHFLNGVPVIETTGQGRAFGIVELFVDPVSHKVLPERTRIEAMVPVCEQVDARTGLCDPRKLREQAEEEPLKMVAPTFRGGPVVPDPSVEALLAPALAHVEAEQRRPLGVEAPRKLGRDREAESALGSVLADALRESAGADVALLNPGGLRADLKAGPVTFGDVYEVLPFDNTVAIVTVTGEELRRLVALIYGMRQSVFQQSGLQVSLAACPGAERLKDVKLANGKSLDPRKLYRVAMPDFLARGGDGLGTVLNTLPAGRIDLGLARELPLRDALIAFWKARGKPIVAPAPGRIAIATGEKCPSPAP
ncbi:bifunctional UDP-sugar hydrolase/5'-nucleotidase [Myxococcaceae bacterium GXIMD 01537]